MSTIGMTRVEEHLDRYRYVYIALLSGAFFCATGVAAARRPLWFDELFTFYISGLPDSGSVLRALLDNADNHPPLDYLIRHGSMQLFGESELGLRLPSILALWLACFCLWRFVSTRTSAIPALVAFCVPLTTLALDYGYEGRPYAFLVAAACLSLYAWQRAVENPKSLWALALLSVSLALGPNAHYYGVFNYAPIIVGEALRSFERRALCLPILVSLLVSFAFLGFVVPFALQARDFAGAFWSRFGIGTPFTFYPKLLSNTVLGAAASLAICVVLNSFTKEPGASERYRNQIPIHEIGAAITFCLIPFMAYVIAYLFTNVLILRCAIVTVVGFALLIAYLTHVVGRSSRACALAMMYSFVFTGLFSLAISVHASGHRGTRVSASFRDFINVANLPIVFSDGFDFFQVYHYVPESRTKIYYFADREGGRKYRHTDTIELALSNVRKVVPLNAVNFSEFILQNSRFLVFIRSDSSRGSGNWILRRLQDNGLDVELHGTVENSPVFLADAGINA